MTKQAENCIDLLAGQPVDKIKQALSYLRSEVVDELMKYYEAKDKDELADKMYLLGQEVIMPIQLENWNIQELTGYVPKTTFYTDFSIADKFGVKSIQATFDSAFDNWKDNVEYLTELVMVLNWKIWRWHEHNDEYATLYDKLWKQADQYCMDNLKGSDLTYYIQTTD